MASLWWKVFFSTSSQCQSGFFIDYHHLNLEFYKNFYIFFSVFNYQVCLSPFWPINCSTFLVPSNITFVVVPNQETLSLLYVFFIYILLNIFKRINLYSLSIELISFNNRMKKGQNTIFFFSIFKSRNIISFIHFQIQFQIRWCWWGDGNLLAMNLSIIKTISNFILKWCLKDILKFIFFLLFLFCLLWLLLFSCWWVDCWWWVWKIRKFLFWSVHLIDSISLSNSFDYAIK